MSKTWPWLFGHFGRLLLGRGQIQTELMAKKLRDSTSQVVLIGYCIFKIKLSNLIFYNNLFLFQILFLFFYFN
jgi:hypothetical protein